MKRKYYMRGMGIGILVTAILCAVALPKKKETMTDEQVIARAKELGYVKDEGGVTADDIDKLKENEKLTGTPVATKAPDTTPDVMPEGPTPSPEPTPEAPNPPEQPDQPDKPTTPTPAKEKPTATSTPKPTATKTPTKAPTATVAPTKEPTKAPTKAPTTKPTEAPKATATPGEASYKVTVERGMTARKVAERLESAGAISDSEDFVKYLVNAKLADLINIGTFTIPQGASYAEIGKILTE